jgi:maltose alpha-D-glucosyltransferase / alpha-amylase
MAPRGDNRWFKNAVIYCLDVDTYRDGNADGIGDFIGLRQSLSYLAGLGVTCLWLLPFYKSPDRDNGYDIIDYLSIHPALGDLGDFVDFMDEARARGIRVIIDLVVNHTSDQHPWFQAARRGDSTYRSYYVWRTDRPESSRDEVVFPGKQTGVWQFDRLAKAFYFHRFYSFQPDLNTSNPAVRAEIKKVMRFWLKLGVSGFRVDAAPFVIAEKSPTASKQPHEIFHFLDEFRDFLSWECGDAVLLAEANVLPDQILNYFGQDGHRVHMVLNFYVNPHLFLALADRSPDPIVRSLSALPQIPENCHWAYFLRNHDELDLSRLTEPERKRCFAAFAPKRIMQLYDRGIRRRLAPMLEGNKAQLLLAYSLIFTLPGAPVLWYGEEIGMGEDLKLPERDSVRTPMQWTADVNAGFSPAPKDKLRRPVISKGPFSYELVNAQAQRRDPGSLLNALERVIRTRKEYPEFGFGAYRVLKTDKAEVIFAHACESENGDAVVAIHNFSPSETRVTVQLWNTDFDHFIYLFREAENQPVENQEIKVSLSPFGFEWLRLKQPVSQPNSPRGTRGKRARSSRK